MDAVGGFAPEFARASRAIFASAKSAKSRRI
jgi:hypothetical protein